ncbi:MAG: FUN14 domain-containing protein [Nitrospira sp.]
MSQHEPTAESPGASGALETLFDDPPWAAKSFLGAGATTLAGLGAWMNDMMSPALARGGASFMGGFLIGWAIRRTVKMAAIMAGLLLTLLAAVKMSGAIDLDWNAIEASITHSLAWVQGKAEGFKEVLTGYLPSAGAGGAGTYFGFRKK